jgi:single-strand DNA-binding protein
MNVITLVGRAGRDPEMKYFESGTMVANLTLAVNSVKRDEEPDWFDLEIWGKTAQVAADYVRKGKQIAVSGRMVTQRWVDRQTGQQRSKLVVSVNQLTLLGSREDGQQQDPGPAQEGYAQAPAQMAPAAAPPQQQQHPAYQAAGWAPNPAAGTVAAQRPPQQQQQAAWNSAPMTAPDGDGIPF